MRVRRLILFAIPVLLSIASGVAVAQFGPRRGPMSGMNMDPRKGVPNWTNDERFKKDVFTFVRVEYNSGGGGGMGLQQQFGGFGQMGGGRRRGGGRGYGGGWAWRTDWPDSDLNFSFRLSAAHLAEGQPRSDHPPADRPDAVRLPVPLHDRAGHGRALLLGRRGRGASSVPLQRRLPDGRRLLGRLPSRKSSTADQAGVPGSRARGAEARARDLPLRLPA